MRRISDGVKVAQRFQDTGRSNAPTWRIASINTFTRTAMAFTS